jgi:hypothetical protein
MFLSFFFHVLVWCWYRTPWEGALSWRKPILFGISGGTTALSIGWVLGLCQPSVWDQSLAYVFGSGLCTEVALITVQTWRGQASHFNNSTPFNSTLSFLTEVLIVVISFLILVSNPSKGQS